MTAVKICGLKRVDDALVAADAGADLIGLVFAPSRRRIDEATAGEIARRVHAETDARAVGVFVNADPAEMNRLAAACDLDYVQLSGDEDEEVVRALRPPVIQVVHVGAETLRDELDRRVNETGADLVLLDAARPGAYGGTGTTFDWSATRELGRPFLLAGGLTPENVAEAVRAVRPWGVDVSSGVEEDGEKSQDKIRRFVRSVKGS